MLPYGRQYIDEDDIEAVAEALRSDFLTTGPTVEKFESALSDVTGAGHVVACSNGTTALHLACMAAGLGEGNTVIVPSLTFLATANAPRYCGADVVFADVDPETGLMRAQDFEEALQRCEGHTVKAVIPVHLAGQCVNLEEINAIAGAKGIKIIVDSAHALGGTCHGKPVGVCELESFNTFSFHPVKTITMGEGGAIATNDYDYANTMRELRNHGMYKTPEQGPWTYKMDRLGYNYRVPDILCALGISQLKKLRGFVERRRNLVAQYDKLMEELMPAIKPPSRVDYCTPAWHLYPVRIDFSQLSINRTEIMDKLAEKGVGTQVHYIPVHTQPYYKKLYGDIVLPGAKHYYESTLSLPMFPAMNDSDINFVVDQLKNVIEGK